MESFTFDFKYNNVKPKTLIGHYEIALFNKNNPIAIDIGSALGTFPLKWHKAFNKIYCIDACYKNIQLLNKNMKNHNIDNVYSFNFAASNKTGNIIKIFNNKNAPYNNVVNNENLILKKNNTLENKEYHNVFSINFKDMLKLFNLQRIDLLKLDIEASEYDFLINEDLSIIDVLVIEIHFIKNEKSIELLKKINENFIQVSTYDNGKHGEYLFINKINQNKIKYTEFDTNNLDNMNIVYN